MRRVIPRAQSCTRVYLNWKSLSRARRRLSGSRVDKSLFLSSERSLPLRGNFPLALRNAKVSDSSYRRWRKEREVEKEREERKARDIRSIFRRHERRRSVAGDAVDEMQPIVRRMETKDNEARKSLNAIGHRSDGETYLARCSLAEPIKERSLGLSAGLNISGQFTSFNALSFSPFHLPFLPHLSLSFSRPFLFPGSFSLSLSLSSWTPTPTPRFHRRETIRRSRKSNWSIIEILSRAAHYHYW